MAVSRFKNKRDDTTFDVWNHGLKILLDERLGLDRRVLTSDTSIIFVNDGNIENASPHLKLLCTLCNEIRWWGGVCQQVEWLLLVLHYGLALALEPSATLPLKSLKAYGPDASSSLAEDTVDFFPLPVTSSVSQYQTHSLCCSCCCFLHYMPSEFYSHLVSLFVFFSDSSPFSFDSVTEGQKGPISKQTNLSFTILHGVLLNTSHKLISTIFGEVGGGGIKTCTGSFFVSCLKLFCFAFLLKFEAFLESWVIVLFPI